MSNPADPYGPSDAVSGADRSSTPGAPEPVTPAPPAPYTSYQAPTPGPAETSTPPPYPAETPPPAPYPAEPPQAPGYPPPGVQLSYGEQSGYGDQAGYTTPPGYGAQPGYPTQAGYPTQPGYAAQPGYGGQPPQVPYGAMVYPAYDPATGQPYSDKSKLVAGILQLVLGAFGAGRFYTGHIGMAIAQIAVTWLTCGLGAIWPLIDGIIILVQGGTDAQGRPLRPS